MDARFGVTGSYRLHNRNGLSHRPPRVWLFLMAAVVVLSGFLPLPVSSTLASATQQPQAGVRHSSSPTKVDLDGTQVAQGSAKSAKLEAVSIVESMNYPNPDETLPGKDLRKEYILNELKASIDGTFRSDNYLEDGSAFEHDVNATQRLEQMLADPKVDEGTKDKAREALRKITQADRLVTAKALGATDLFGTDLPQGGFLALDRASQELAKGDSNVDKGMLADAIRDYHKAWQYADEAIDLLWAHFDPDGDKLLPGMEKRAGTDPDKADTDADGLTDGEEIVGAGTDPTQADPPSSDRDNDGLADRQELQKGTDPLRPDTDGEGLDDGFEVGSFGSDPTEQDTDTDGLTDDSERRLGTDPRDSDVNVNGSLDGFETYTSEKTAGELGGNGVSVNITGMGDVAREVEFEDLPEDRLLQQMPGQLSSPVDIASGKPFTNARVEIGFDPAEVPNGDYQGVGIMYWDQEIRTFVPLDSQGVNVQDGYAWADTDHFTTFVLFHIPTWETVWQKEMGDDGRRSETDPDLKNLDVVLDIDSSGSMSWNDPYGYRKTASKSFIDALIEGDKVGVVDFDSSARLYQPLTTDHAAAKRAVEGINSSGGTNIASGVQLSLDEIDRNADPSHLKAIILLTDGEGYYTHSLTQRARNSDVVIYTIGLGDSVDEYLLRSIAEQTDGAYYPVTSAEDLPQVFRRIADGEPTPDDGTDTDGDGLTDRIETGGFRGGNGVFVTTDPNDIDTDGDGLEDGEEAGDLSTSTFGDYFSTPTNPAYADPDDDGLDDSADMESGTDPNNPDTDGDRLSDTVELGVNFDPTEANPDSDEYTDAEELDADADPHQSDPFHYDRTGLENLKDVGAGAVLGDVGDDYANLGIVDNDTIRSFGYLRGWILSGLLALADIRDAVAADAEGDDKGALLNLLGVLSFPAAQVPGTIDAIDTFASWSPEL